MTEPIVRPFTLWIAHPDRWAIASADESNWYAHQPGWWRTAWTGNAHEAEALRQRLQTAE